MADTIPPRADIQRAMRWINGAFLTRAFLIPALLAMSILAGPASVPAMEFPELIIEPDAPDPSSPAGSFVRTRSDFIVCRGKEGKGDPPKGGPGIRFAGQDYPDTGAFNNMIVDGLEKNRDRTELMIARQKWEAALKSDPQFFPFLYNLGRVFLLLNLPENAIRILDKARGILPAFAGTYLLLGQAYARAGDDRAAVVNFREASKRNRLDLSPLIALGNFYLSRREMTQARTYYDKVLEVRPDDVNARIGLGRIFMEKGDPVRARYLLKEIQTENIDGSERKDYDRSLHYFRAVLATELRDYGDAVREYDRLLKHPDDPFFLETSIKDIQRRREIARRLAEASGSSLEQ